ncbi:hypothetical protein HDU83_007970, partial [Entophlyctis luteolus]
DIVIRLLKQAIDKVPKNQTILVDGFPRTVDQAIHFENAISQAHSILNFTCPLSTLEKRLLERGKTSGRSDDNVETIRKRFSIFEKESSPVLEYFGDRVISIDGTSNVDLVYEEVKHRLREVGALPDSERDKVFLAVGNGKKLTEVLEFCERLSGEFKLHFIDAHNIDDVVDPGTDNELAIVHPVKRTDSENEDEAIINDDHEIVHGFADELDGDLAEQLLQVVQDNILQNANSVNPHAGILIEADFGWSSLFTNPSESENPALVLFSYSIASTGDPHLPEPDEAKSVLEIFDFEPHEEVYTNTKSRLLTESLGRDFEHPPIIFVLGGPGSGKGTQCAKLKAEYDLTHLSAGDLLRAEVASGSEVGVFCDTIMKEGKIVPMNIIIKLLRNAIERAPNDRAILVDGFPRALDQAQEFEKSVRPAAAIVNFTCPLSVLETRLLERGKTSGRSDDNIETIRKRFATFQNESMPVIEWFGDRVITIDGSQPVEEVYEHCRSRLLKIGVLSSPTNVIFAIGDGSYKGQSHKFCCRLAEDLDLKLVSFGPVVSSTNLAALNEYKRPLNDYLRSPTHMASVLEEEEEEETEEIGENAEIDNINSRSKSIDSSTAIPTSVELRRSPDNENRVLSGEYKHIRPRKSVQELELRIQSLMEQNAQLAKARNEDSMLAQQLSTEIREITRENRLLRLKVGTLESELTSSQELSENSLNGLRVELEKARHDIDTLAAEKEAHDVVVLDLTVKLDEAKLEVVRELKAVALENETLASILEQQTSRFEFERESHKAVVGLLQSKLNQAEEDLRISKETFAGINLENEALRTQVNVEKIELEKMQTDHDAERKEASEKIIDLERRLADSESKLDLLDATNRNLFGDYKALLSQKQSRDDESFRIISQLQSQIAELSEELKITANQRTSALLALEEAENELDAADKRITELNEVINSMKGHLAKLIEQVKKSRVVSLEDHIAKLEKTIAALKAETQYLKSLISARK